MEKKGTANMNNLEEMEQNRMGTAPVKKLVWNMGLPMIFSMVLQALYNIVDTAFVINIPDIGTSANLALTYAFPIQIFMIAVGVGTGIGINALLTRNLGRGDKEAVSKAAGNGLFLGFVFYLAFLLFGLFGTRPFISVQARSIGDEAQRSLVIDLGSSYLSICCTLSIGQMLFTVYERFLQAAGKNTQSMIGQMSGALLNILLDYVLIYPAGLGVAGAAYATVIGQFVSLLVDMAFHYLSNKEIQNTWKSLVPDRGVISQIFAIGVPAMVMQALLSVMMLGTNVILSFAKYNCVTLQGSFGIYYKIQQIALFACFGLSNALITLTSYNYGKMNFARVKEIQKYGILDSLIVALFITALFEIFASPIGQVFALASGSEGGEVTETTVNAIRIGSIGFVFMAFSIAVQGLLQGIRSVFSPLIISLLRLAVFTFPLVYIFSLPEGNLWTFWFAFPISELLTSFASYLLLRHGNKKRVTSLIRA